MTNEELYKLAADSVRRNKFTQALGYFDKILSKDPEHLEARKGARAVAKKVAPQNKIVAKLKSLPLLFKIKKISKTEDADYDEGFRLCEQYLRVDPESPFALTHAAEFAAEKKYVQSACFYYECLVEIDPDDADAVVLAADYLSDQHNKDMMDKANVWMAHIVSQDQNDVELISEQSRIAAKKVINAFERASHSHEILKNDQEAVSLELDSQQIKSVSDLERAIERAHERDKAEPNSSRCKETLGDLYTRAKDYEKAMGYYNEVIVLDNNNELARAKMGDLTINILMDQLDNIQGLAKKNSGSKRAELLAQIKEIKKEITQVRFKEFNRRLKVNPNDMGTRFLLGELLYNANEYDKAIQQFQKSVSDANHGFKSTMLLGLSFKAKSLFDMAIHQFEDAQKKPGVKTSNRIEIQYEIGLCHVELKQRDLAIDVFKKILERDFGYRDVASRVEELTKQES